MASLYLFSLFLFFPCLIFSFEIPTEDKFTASDGGAGDNFGHSVSISGSLVLVGAPGDGSSLGSAYLFNCPSSSCTQLAKLSASDEAIGDQFGRSVSLSGSLALVGAFLDDSRQGSAYLFNCNPLPCIEVDKLTASDGAPTHRFGFSVSISKTLALVGSYFYDLAQGSAYLFDCSSLPCNEVDKLEASDGATSDNFGWSVSLSGSLALVGAYGKNSLQGAAYLFNCSSIPCNEVDKLEASDGAAGDFLGFSVSISGTFALVGALQKNSFQGAAYLFDCSSLPCNEVDKLEASDGAAGDYFSYSVSISGSMALVGATRDNSRQGAAYLFDCSSSSCIQVAKLTASDRAANDELGSSVSISDSSALIGALGFNSGQGSAYLTCFFSF